MLRTRCDDAYLFFIACDTRRNGRAADKIAWSDFEHHVICDGPKGKIQDVFCNAVSDRGAPGTYKTGIEVNTKI